MKKLFALLIIFSIFCSVFTGVTFTVKANALTEGYYTYTITNGKATIIQVSTDISGDITVPSTLGGYPVTVIGEGAFYDCDGLTSINIPANITWIQYNVFAYCDNITKMTVDKDNKYYYSQNNCIIDDPYSKKLVCACKTSVMPDNISVISRNVFASRSDITQIKIPDSVQFIDSDAFSGCDNLETIYLGKNVRLLGLGAFGFCDNLKTVYFGSREQLQKIHDNRQNESLWKATWIFYCDKGHTFGKYQNIFPYDHERECTVCGYIETENHSWDNGKITLNSNCSEQGEKTYTCTYCLGTKVDVITYNPSVHKFGKWTVTKKATCTEPGKKTAECSLCHKISTEIIDPIGHNVTNFITSVEPSCTKEGVKIGCCSRCGLKGAEQKIPVLEHSFGESVIIKPATNNEEGLSEKTCSSCGFKSEEILPKLSLSNNDSNTSLPTEAPPTPTSTNTPPIPDNKENTNTLGIVVAVFGGACVLSCGVFITVTVIKRKNKK